MKKLKLSIASGKQPADPLEIFKRLTLRGKIEGIWGPQMEALTDWHRDHRGDSDVVLQMNTGGGKTLVGLLMAQSLVNDTKGRVVYVCANNQLVQQTAVRAQEIGLTPALRYGGNWQNESAFHSGEVFCLTNYHTVFNGRSIFLRDDAPDALVFDDAHVAERTIRDCFTLRIPSDHDAFRDILGILRKHFASSPRASQFEDISKGEFTSVLFVPMFVVWQHGSEIRKTLIKHGVEQLTGTMFAWSHISEHVNHCCILMDGRGLEVAPATIPLSILPYFSNKVRRIYLTATLPSQASFTRTFGVVNPTVIQPSGKSGDAQRLFVFVPGDDDERQRDTAKQLVQTKKCCVISPSTRKAKQWEPESTIYETGAGQDEIDRFQKSDEPEMLGLVARYDGIDLPGKSCRILILDRLPKGESLIERFIDEGIKVETIRISQTATRVVQAIGRIFRSNTDHGVVLLVGSELQSWLRNPKWQAYLPALLQQQVLLSIELAKEVEKKEETWPVLMNGVLSGDKNWDDTYMEYIDQFPASAGVPETDWYVELLPRERNAYEELWDGQYAKAADEYDALAIAAHEHEPRLEAWYRHWRGLCLMCAEDRSRALSEFVSAANVRSELGRPSKSMAAAFEPPKAKFITRQATILAARYESKKAQIVDAMKQVETDLRYGPDTSKAEEALRHLGALLGLHTKRADKKAGSGPDVLWKAEDGDTTWGFELKTNKESASEYTKKDDIGQCHNHEQWLKEQHGKGCRWAIVGRMNRVSRQSNPSPTLRVIEVEAFRGLLERVKDMFDAVEAGDKANLPHEFQRWIDFYGLNWPTCADALDYRLAIDLRDQD